MIKVRSPSGPQINMLKHCKLIIYDAFLFYTYSFTYTFNLLDVLINQNHIFTDFWYDLSIRHHRKMTSPKKECLQWIILQFATIGGFFLRNTEEGPLLILFVTNLDFWEVVSNKKSSKTGMAFQNKIIILLKPLQMFLPFEYDTKSNETFFDKVRDRKSTRLNSSHRCISYAVF